MVLDVVTFISMCVCFFSFFETGLISVICSQIWDDIEYGKVVAEMLVFKHICLLKYNI